MDAWRTGQSDAKRFRALAPAAVEQIVRRQHEVGIDIVSDGEQSKTGFVEYVATRLSGIRCDHIPLEERKMNPVIERDWPEYRSSRYMHHLAQAVGAMELTCVGPIEYV